MVGILLVANGGRACALVGITWKLIASAQARNVTAIMCL